MKIKTAGLLVLGIVLGLLMWWADSASTILSTILQIICMLTFVIAVFVWKKKPVTKFDMYIDKKLFTIIMIVSMPLISISQMVNDSLSVNDYLFQGMSFNMLYASYIVAGVGVFLRWIWTTNKGIKNINNNSPNKFNLLYWLKNNGKRKLLSVISVVLALYLLFRFAGEFLNMEFSIGLSAIIGLSLDYFVDKLKNFKLK